MLHLLQLLQQLHLLLRPSRLRPLHRDSVLFIYAIYTSRRHRLLFHGSTFNRHHCQAHRLLHLTAESGASSRFIDNQLLQGIERKMIHYVQLDPLVTM